MGRKEHKFGTSKCPRTKEWLTPTYISVIIIIFFSKTHFIKEWSADAWDLFISKTPTYQELLLKKMGTPTQCMNLYNHMTMRDLYFPFELLLGSSLLLWWSNSERKESEAHLFSLMLTLCEVKQYQHVILHAYSKKLCSSSCL